MMKRLLFCLFAALLLAPFGCDKTEKADSEPGSPAVAEQPAAPAQRSPTADKAEAPSPEVSAGDQPQAAEDDAAFEKSLLWRVESEHGPVYLFGTVHGGIDADWSEYPADVRKAFEASELVVLEADIANAGAEAMKLRDKMVYTGDKTLRTELGDERFEKLADEVGKPEPMIERLRPWVVYSELVRAWLPPGRAVDEVIQTQGQRADKEFAFIETIPEQVEILSEAITPELLIELLERLDEMKASQNAMIEAYYAGNASRIAKEAFAAEDVERFPKLYEALFDRRNEAWMSDIEGYIERGHVFVAVGVGHLVGDDSVVALLEDRGYEVVRTADAPESQ